MTSRAIELGKLAQVYGRALSTDVAGLIGAEIAIESPAVDQADRADLGGSGDPLLHTPAEVGDGGGTVHLLTGRREAVVLASLLMGLDQEAIPEREKQGFDDELRNAYGEVMKAACTALGRVNQELGLPALEPGAPSEVPAPQDSDDWIPVGRYRRVAFTLRLPDDLGEGRLAVAIPAEVARRWFGGEEDASGAAAESLGEMGALVVIDSDEDSRSQAEELEDSVGWTIWTFNSSEFGLDTFEEIAEASAILVDWNLGGYSAVDLVETLVQDPRTAHIPVVVVSTSPKKAIVKAAIRAGACSFAFKPYDAEELAARLAPFVPQIGASHSGAAEVPGEATTPDPAPEGEATASEETGEAAPEAADGAEA